MPQRTCTIGDCARPHQARGLCGSHYNQTYSNPVRAIEIACSQCGTPAWRIYKKQAAHRFCSRQCSDTWHRERRPPRPPKAPPEPKPKPDRRGPLRIAYESGDLDQFITLLRERSTITYTNCWIWQGRIKDGYAELSIGTGAKPVHRALAILRWPHLGSLPVHHMCANTTCVNPFHHVPASHAENVAEMLARRWYEERIEMLEHALRIVSPSHPALAGACG